MKFNTFKISEAEQVSAIVAASIAEPVKSFIGRTIIRDWNADRWDTEALDAKMCPDCGADTSFREGVGSKNIAYYECKKKPQHRFVRIFSKPTTTASTLAAATAHTTQVLQSALTVAERTKNG